MKRFFITTFTPTFLFAAILGATLLGTACGSRNSEKNNGETPQDSIPTTTPGDSVIPPEDEPTLNVDTTLATGYRRVRFAPTDEIFCNPERGFFSHLEWTNVGTPASNQQLQNLRNQGLSLVLNVYYMSSYIEKELDEPMLQLVADNLTAARNNGMKVVLRFAYSKSMASGTVFDAPLEMALKHLAQLKPIIRANADVIACMEAGFVGAWGEWYYTDNYGQDGFVKYDLRKQLIDSMLRVLPPERMICLRVVKYKPRMLGGKNVLLADTLTQSEAYSQTPKARLAYHNDCFVASENDMGTFFSTTDRLYCQADSRYVVVGGETCAPSDYSGCENSLKQLHDYHWSYLNQDYHQSVIGGWRLNGCLDDVKRRLGYRFELSYADAPATVQIGGEMQVKVLLRNHGFAAPYNPRDVYLVLLDNAGNEVQRAKQTHIDPRFWMADEYRLLTLTLPVPVGIATGQYTVALALPDPQPTLADRPEYAIRFANEGIWNEAKGLNTLFQLAF